MLSQGTSERALTNGACPLILELSAYETRERKDRVCRINYGLALGWQTN